MNNIKTRNDKNNKNLIYKQINDEPKKQKTIKYKKGDIFNNVKDKNKIVSVVKEKENKIY